MTVDLLEGVWDSDSRELLDLVPEQIAPGKDWPVSYKYSTISYYDASRLYKDYGCETAYGGIVMRMQMDRNPEYTDWWLFREDSTNDCLWYGPGYTDEQKFARYLPKMYALCIEEGQIRRASARAEERGVIVRPTKQSIIL